MRAQASTLGILAEIALRNLLANRWKTSIVGGVISLGALVVVLGGSLLEAVDHGMRRTITGSIAGDIQVYSAASKDEIDVTGGIAIEPSLAPVEDFARVRRVLLGVANVKAVVPMAMSTGLVSVGNAIDRALSTLRATTNARLRDGSSSDVLHDYAAQKEHVQQILRVLHRDIENARQIKKPVPVEEITELENAASDRFWRAFDDDPYAHLELLENRIAPHVADDPMKLLRYVGTDPATFSRAFERMEVVDGELIPPGQRGFMFSKLAYEDTAKLRTARGLDKLKAGIDERHAKIASDPELKRIVRENAAGVREILLQLDAIKTISVRHKLQTFLNSTESDVGVLLAQFFATDDANFQSRYRYFYAALAPELQLYRVKIGDTVTIRTLDRSGYPRAANIKVYGTYTFRGLEKSGLAGSINMMDLVSMRELHGLTTTASDPEMESLRAAAGVKTVKRDDIESELFGSKVDPREAVISDASSVERVAKLRGTRARLEQLALASYDPRELEQGVVLSVAVLLRDEDKLTESLHAIERATRRAGLPLKAVAWQNAAGFLGQFTTMMRGVLFVAELIIFIVAVVVINNALVMAALERVREFGALRALGAQRNFILAVLMFESVAIGLSASTFGAAVGGLALAKLHQNGIPANGDAMAFIFSGPRLFPAVSAAGLVFALAIMLVVSMASGIYPAWLAMRVSPREAMQAEE